MRSKVRPKPGRVFSDQRTRRLHLTGAGRNGQANKPEAQAFEKAVTSQFLDWRGFFAGHPSCLRSCPGGCPAGRSATGRTHISFPGE